MSAEEETERLLEIVQAFEVSPMDVDAAGGEEQAATAAGAGRAAACGCGLADDPTLTVVPAELVRPLWGGSDEPALLPESTIAAAAASWLGGGAALPQEMEQQVELLTSSLRTRGFAVVQLGEETAAGCGGVLTGVQQPVARDEAEKEACADGSFRYAGYQHREAFEKELFQVRVGSDESAIWQGAGSALRAPALAGFGRLGQLAYHVFCLACRAADISAATASELMEPWLSAGAASPAQGGWSQSNLSLFHYYAARECVHCPQHSDIGLVTVIPTARGGAGLNIFDWQSACWFDVETSAPPNVALVFTGESLAAASSATRVRPPKDCVTQSFLRRPQRACGCRAMSRRCTRWHGSTARATRWLSSFLHAATLDSTPRTTRRRKRLCTASALLGSRATLRGSARGGRRLHATLHGNNVLVGNVVLVAMAQ